jgi:multidrug efflux pump subunit AcrA (membrane-fusion protein)
LHNKEESSMARASEQSSEPPFTAADLRARIAERQGDKAAEKMRLNAAAAQAQKELVDHFMNAVLTEKEIEALRNRVRAAVERGELEVQLGEFPAALCSDGGRAINNLEKDWPETLQGKARQVYELWRERLREKGYRLHARVENFPGGMPGNVGVYLSWKE